MNEALSFNRRAQVKGDRRVLDIIDASVHIYQGTADIYDTAHLIKRLEGMVENLARKNEAAEQEAERARSSMRRAIVMAMDLRGMNCSDAFRQRIEECKDMDLLENWQMLALTAKTEAQVLGEKQ